MNHVEYLNKNVLCTVAPSSIHGVGIFAIQDIKKGQELCNYTEGIITFDSEEDINKLIPEVKEIVLQRTTFEVGKPLTIISPNREQYLQAYMNHSNSANSDGIKALRDIKKGEEVTEDYRTLSVDMHPISKNFYHEIIR